MTRFVATFILLMVLLGGCSEEARPLKPIRPIPPTPSTIYSNIDDLALDATHAQLFDASDAYLDQLIRIEGSLGRIDAPACLHHKGPLMQWGLVGLNNFGETVLMNAYGFEKAVELVSDGTPFLIEGVWKRYTGALGCGKEPPTQTIYYLEVIEILQPNPLVRGAAIAVESNSNNGQAPDIVIIDEDITIVLPESENNAVEAYPGNDQVVVVEVTAVPTVDSAEPTRITPPTATPSPTRESQNSTPTRTPFPTSEPNVTPTSTRTPFPTSEVDADDTPTPDDTTTEPTATPTPDSEAIATATATPTVEGDPTETPDPDETEEPEPTDTPDPDETTEASIGTTEAGDGDTLPTPDTSDPTATDYPAPTPTPYPPQDDD